jgi:hypothetical protein
LERHDLIVLHGPAINGIAKGVECFLKLTVSGAQILREISRQVAAEPFGDQAWRSACGVPQLVMQIAIGPDGALS